MSQGYNREEWKPLLSYIFNKVDLFSAPHQIAANNDSVIGIWQFGSILLDGNRKVALLDVEVADSVRLRHNRRTLRDIAAKYIDQNIIHGALVFYFSSAVQEYRFSFISKESSFDAEGLEVDTQTHPKRFTYLLGTALCNTAVQRFEKLASKQALFPLTMSDLVDAFSVESLTKEFYRELSDWYFWALDKVTFPADFEKDESIRNASSMIRLITRLMFVWFIKQKGLVPDELFDENELHSLLKYDDVTGSTYYKAILQNLFFATLNTEIKGENRQFVKRQTGEQEYYRYKRFFKNTDRFLELTKDIPFLNGGLFENLDKNPGQSDEMRIDCFSNQKSNETRLCVPDFLFFGGTKHANLNKAYGDASHSDVYIRGLIDILKSYNFTIEENTSYEIEVALDPELLGKVFENLLASFNPETQSTARKQTGSFYTPREVVSFMVDESLLIYLKNCLLDAFPEKIINVKTQFVLFGDHNSDPQQYSNKTVNNRWVGKESDLENKLRELFQEFSSDNPFNPYETDILLTAIDNCKILDPACGSGAFPMGVLQRMVAVLQKLDPANKEWRKLQKEKAIRDVETVLSISDREERQQQLLSIEKVFSENASDYGRKLFLIKNCIYGVDIQPIAVQISKLRFFISLVCDQSTDTLEQKLNIRPLPNLETKFVCADTLIGLNKMEGMDLHDPEISKLIRELRNTRFEHFSVTRKDKKRDIREKDKIIRRNIATLIKANYRSWEDDLKDRLSHLELSLSTGHSSISRKWVQEQEGRIENIFGAEAKILKDDVSAYDNSKLKTYLVMKQKEIDNLKSLLEMPKQRFDEMIADFNIYDQVSTAKWFDPEWMFGVLGGFNIIIGNPPYIAIQRINTSIKNNVTSQNYSTFENTGDIYALFYERGIQLLCKGGLLAYITSRQWMQAAYGKSLRKFLSTQCNPIQLIDFGQVKIFEGATVFVNIIIIENNLNKNTLLACLLPVDYNLEHNDLKTFFSQNSQLITNITETNWVISNLSELNRQILKKGKQLFKFLELKELEFSRGITSGLNEAFHIDSQIKQYLIEQDPNNINIIEPLLRGKDIKRYAYDFQNIFIINTHNGVREFNILPINVKKDYPTIYKYLSGWKRELKERQDQGNHWSNLRNCAFLLEFSKPKIVWIEISDRANFAYDDKGMFLTNSAYFITSNSKTLNLKYLLAVLNSKISDFYFSQITARIAGGRMRYTKQYVEQIPIPVIDIERQIPFITVVDYILCLKSVELSNSIDKSMSLFFEKVLDLAVFELFFMEEMRKAGYSIFKYIEKFPDMKSNVSLDAIRLVYNDINNQNHPIRNAVSLLKNHEPFKTIEDTLNRRE